jgi:hypothetical protein
MELSNISPYAIIGLIWLVFPLRMLIDRSMTPAQRWSWALVAAVVPIAGYILFLIVRAVRVSLTPHRA